MVGVQVPHRYIFLTLIIGDDHLNHILRELGIEPELTSDVPTLRNALLFAIGCKNYERGAVSRALGI